MVRSMVFTLVCAGLTYLVVTSSTPTFYKVDLSSLLQDQAKSLAKSGMTPEKLHLEMTKFKEDLSHKLSALAHKKKGIILTSGAFGDIQDITKELDA